VAFPNVPDLEWLDGFQHYAGAADLAYSYPGTGSGVSGAVSIVPAPGDPTQRAVACTGGGSYLEALGPRLIQPSNNWHLVLDVTLPPASGNVCLAALVCVAPDVARWSYEPVYNARTDRFRPRYQKPWSLEQRLAGPRLVIASLWVDSLGRVALRQAPAGAAAPSATDSLMEGVWLAADNSTVLGTNTARSAVGAAPPGERVQLQWSLVVDGSARGDEWGVPWGESAPGGGLAPGQGRYGAAVTRLAEGTGSSARTRVVIGTPNAAGRFVGATNANALAWNAAGYAQWAADAEQARLEALALAGGTPPNTAFSDGDEWYIREYYEGYWAATGQVAMPDAVWLGNVAAGSSATVTLHGCALWPTVRSYQYVRGELRFTRRTLSSGVKRTYYDPVYGNLDTNGDGRTETVIVRLDEKQEQQWGQATPADMTDTGAALVEDTPDTGTALSLNLSTLGQAGSLALLPDALPADLSHMNRAGMAAAYPELDEPAAGWRQPLGHHQYVLARSPYATDREVTIGSSPYSYAELPLAAAPNFEGTNPVVKPGGAIDWGYWSMWHHVHQMSLEWAQQPGATLTTWNGSQTGTNTYDVYGNERASERLSASSWHYWRHPENIALFFYPYLTTSVLWPLPTAGNPDADYLDTAHVVLYLVDAPWDALLLGGDGGGGVVVGGRQRALAWLLA
jgi:hypothetical protein